MDITLVFFVYGLAFFCMGLAMLLEAGRSPLLAEARVLIPLVIFGFVHGSHEWLEMFLDKSDWYVFRDPEIVSWIRIALLVISFTSLILFGIRMWDPRRQLSTMEVLLISGVLILYISLLLFIGLSYRNEHGDWLYHLDVLARYGLGVTGALLAGLALLRQSSYARSHERPGLGIGMRIAGIGFFLYSLTQIVVPPVDIFLARVLNTATFVGLTGLPIQVLRAILAVLITIGMIRAIQAAEYERQEQLLMIQQSRLDALERVQQELVKREQMRQELLRRAVIAQEEERARIARELHDETAQVLTAFSLHVAAMGESVSGNFEVAQRISQLQTLNRQMSSGIYRLIHDLRPAQLDDLGLVPALLAFQEEMREKFEFQMDLEIDGDQQRLDPLIETVLFRVTQEAITNCVRHAGVSQARVQLEFSQHEVRMAVSDQGAGFNLDESWLPPHGWGLVGMRERAQSVGGDLDLYSRLGEGTRIIVSIPLSENKETFHGQYPFDVSR